MPYTLLFSRSIQSDAVMRITDVPITDKNVMIEVLSLISPFRRLAGYAYALRSDGITDYERSSGVTLPFGKNRVSFRDATVPYGLEFFPRWGVKSGIISVYTGEPSSTPPPSGSWKQSPTGPYQLRLSVSPNGVFSRTTASDELWVVRMDGAIEGVMYESYVYWKTVDGVIRMTETGSYGWSAIKTEEEYNSVRATPSAVLL